VKPCKIYRRAPAGINRATVSIPLYASQHTLRHVVDENLPISSIKKVKSTYLFHKKVKSTYLFHTKSQSPTIYVSLEGTVKDKVNCVYKQHGMMQFGGKAKLSLYRPWRPLGLPEFEAPQFSDIRLIDGSKFVSPMRRPLFTPRKIPGTHFC
jgi:hypothetical protein